MDKIQPEIMKTLDGNQAALTDMPVPHGNLGKCLLIGKWVFCFFIKRVRLSCACCPNVLMSQLGCDLQRLLG